MRRSLVALAWVVLVGCGGGGGGGSSSNPVSGTLGGQAFTPAEVSAVLAGPAHCTVQSNSVDVKALALRFGSSTGLCGDLQSDPLCKLVASSRTVTLILADVGGLTGPTLGNGTFTVDSNPTSIVPGSGDLTGTFVVSFGGSTATTATCPAGTTGQVAKGTLTVTSLTASAVTGSVDLTFGTVGAGGAFTPGGDTLKGDFTATVCGNLSGDLCSLATTGGVCASPHC